MVNHVLTFKRFLYKAVVYTTLCRHVNLIHIEGKIQC